MASRDISPAPFPLSPELGLQPAERSAQTVSFVFPRVRDRYWLHALLFLITLFTTTAVGAAMQYDFAHNAPFLLERAMGILLPFPFPDASRLAAPFWRQPSLFLTGLPFSLTLMAILTAHELGHYIAAMYHGVDASLPYFLPSPVLGTFGAFIRVRSPIYSKRALFDIGVAGPLAGFAFLLPALGIGLAFSKVVPGIGVSGDLQFGIPLLQWLLQHAIFPGVKTGDVYLHPIARAAWIGMFMTSMNLLPIGQLDGGHILYSFFPRRHKLVSTLACVLMLPLGRLWVGWSFWGFVLLLVGRRHPSIYDPAGLGRGRTQLGWLAVAIFLLCLIYVPFPNSGF